MTSSVLEQWLAREHELRTQHAQGPGPGVNDMAVANTSKLLSSALLKLSVNGVDMPAV